MWGGVKGAIPEMTELVGAWSNRERYMGDLDFLNSKARAAVKPATGRPLIVPSHRPFTAMPTGSVRARRCGPSRRCGVQTWPTTRTRAPSIPTRGPSRRAGRSTTSTSARSSGETAGHGRTTSTRSWSAARCRRCAGASPTGSLAECLNHDTGTVVLWTADDDDTTGSSQ